MINIISVELFRFKHIILFSTDHSSLRYIRGAARKHFDDDFYSCKNDGQIALKIWFCFIIDISLIECINGTDIELTIINIMSPLNMRSKFSSQFSSE